MDKKLYNYFITYNIFKFGLKEQASFSSQVFFDLI